MVRPELGMPQRDPPRRILRPVGCSAGAPPHLFPGDGAYATLRRMLRGRETPGSVDRREPVEIVSGAYPRLLRIARSLTPSKAAAEDLVQEAFVETLSRYPDFLGLRTPVGYLTTVLYRSAFRARRSSEREIPTELQERFELREPDRDAPVVVAGALATLAPKQRACVALRYLYDLDEGEIAAVLGCRPSTVRSQLARGLANARGRIEVNPSDE